MSKQNKNKKAASVAPSPPPSPTPEIESTPRRRLAGVFRLAAAVLLLLCATYATYRESLSGRLFFDDHSAIERNTNIRALVDPTTRWRVKTWIRAASSDVESPLSGRPVVSLSFALNHWWASAVRPTNKANFDGVAPAHVVYFHYVNLAIHMLVALLIFALVRRTMTAPNLGECPRSTADLWALFIALVWAVHPLNTETVVYVTQRTEQIVSLFLLLTLYCSARAFDAETSRRRTAWYTAAVIASLLGMASKENMIAAPLLVAAYDRAFNYPDWATAIRRRRWFYLAVAATWVVLAIIMASNPRGETVGFNDPRLPWYEYLITQCWCLWRYFWLTLIPIGGKLCVDYGRCPVLEFHHTAPGALLVLSLLGLTVWGWMRKPWVGFLGAWFFLILAPTSSFYPIVTEIGAERRMYLPSAAILAGLIAGTVGLVSWMRSKFEVAQSPEWFRWATRAGLLAAFVPIAWLAYTSHQRNRVYQDDLTLYGHIVDVFPDNDRGCNNFGTVCLNHGLTEQALNLLNRALRIDPQYGDALTNRGWLFLKLHEQGVHDRLDLAIADSTDALNWRWADFTALNNRATAFMEAKQYDRAEADYDRLITLVPAWSAARSNQAQLYFEMGDLDPKHLETALKSVDESLRIDPDLQNAHNTRGLILDKLGRYDQAIVEFDKALDCIRREAGHLLPDTDIARSWKATESSLAEISATNRRPKDSKQQEAMRLFPHRGVMAAIFSNRAAAYQELAKQRNGKAYRNRALDDLSRAAYLDEGNPRFYASRGELYLETGLFGEALHDFDTALAIHRFWPAALRGRLQTNAKLGNYPAAKQDAEQLRKLGLPLDAATIALIDDVLTKSAAP